MKKLSRLTITQIHQAISRKEISSVEITKYYLDKINKLDGKINSFITLNSKAALKTAKKVDSLIANKQKLCWLSGVPGALKDVIVTKDLKTTAGSAILSDFVPPYDAAVTERLESVFSPILGKTNLDEFAMGSSTENSAYGVVSNPYDEERVPGGSSGGSAAAVAADMCAYALGSDTGGSIRQPASFCGVVGLKPTYGRVSRYGLVAYGSSLDTIGPITKTVEDAALVLNIIAGHDEKDATSATIGLPNYSQNLKKGLKGLKIGVPKQYFPKELAKDVNKVVKDAIKNLNILGSDIVEVDLPHTDLALSVYYLIAPSEASSNLARYDGLRFGKQRDEFGKEVVRRIILGTYALSSGYYDEYYLKAARVRNLIIKDFAEAFKKVDVLATPVSLTTAFKKGEKSTPLEMYRSDIFTIPVNLAGLPALSIPCGFSEGLPIGLQLIGPEFSESTLLQVGFALEEELK